MKRRGSIDGNLEEGEEVEGGEGKKEEEPEE